MSMSVSVMHTIRAFSTLKRAAARESECDVDTRTCTPRSLPFAPNTAGYSSCVCVRSRRRHAMRVRDDCVEQPDGMSHARRRQLTLSQPDRPAR